MPPSSDASENLLKGLSAISHITKSSKDKMLLADPNWEREMICQVIEKMLVLGHKLLEAKKATNSIQTTTDKIFYV